MIRRVLLGLCSLLLTGLIDGANASIPYHDLGKIPVVNSGRVKPLDSIARETILFLQEKQTVRHQNKRYSPIQWLGILLSSPQQANAMSVFKINNADVKHFIGDTSDSRSFFSYNDIEPSLEKLSEQYQQAAQIDAQRRSVFQRHIVILYQKVQRYHQLKYSFFIHSTESFFSGFTRFKGLVNSTSDLINHSGPSTKFTDEEKDSLNQLYQFIKTAQIGQSLTLLHPLPPSDDQQDWMTIPEGFKDMLSNPPHPLIESYSLLFDQLGTQSSDAGQTIDQILAYFQSNHSQILKDSNLEWWFNTLQPFYWCLIFYLIAFFVALVMLAFKLPISDRVLYRFVQFSFVCHTLGILARMLIQNRPPVTNLYSSAVVVGWGIVGLGLLMHKYFPNKLALLMSTISGWVTLIVAHHLSLQGDTLEMMQAVLDSNFWLATHVIVITLGYSGTYLAGALGIAYVLINGFKKGSQNINQSLVKMVFGILCISLLFSFVGTVLGGIWADQSWGRFWGWDPKENGALLIILWNAVMLHARLDGTIGERGFMCAAIFGNIVTSFSWFGVNMLGIGLHSYGFMEESFKWLLSFMILHLGFIIFGLLHAKQPNTDN